MGLRGRIRKPLIRRFGRQIEAARYLAYRHWPSKRFVNLGGGPDFVAIGWVNFDSARGPHNPDPYEFTETSRLDLEDRSVDLVYSSHFLEHVPPEVGANALREAHRILRGRGRLVLKLPDGDATLDAWRRGDTRFFSDEFWAFGAIVDTWPTRNVPDTIDYRAATVFCGYWNAAWGDHFSREIRRADGAYHGPPAMEVNALRRLLGDCTPFEIARQLRQYALAESADLTFSHQCAWSREELARFVEDAGFRVRSMEPEHIRRTYRKVPGIKQMRAISMYLEADKPS